VCVGVFVVDALFWGCVEMFVDGFGI
jgi:hypothetical protein